MKKVMYKIKARSVNDYQEIWWFETFEGALVFCYENYYINKQDYLQCKKDGKCSLIVMY